MRVRSEKKRGGSRGGATLPAGGLGGGGAFPMQTFNIYRPLSGRLRLEGAHGAMGFEGVFKGLRGRA